MYTPRIFEGAPIELTPLHKTKFRCFLAPSVHTVRPSCNKERMTGTGTAESAVRRAGDREMRGRKRKEWGKEEEERGKGT